MWPVRVGDPLPLPSSILIYTRSLQGEVMRRYSLALLACVACSASAQTYIYDQDGYSFGQVEGEPYFSQRFGETTIGRIGDQSFHINQVGDQSFGRFGNESLNHNQIGNQGQGRVGNQSYSTTTIGNQTFITNGTNNTTCTRIGNSVVCN